MSRVFTIGKLRRCVELSEGLILHSDMAYPTVLLLLEDMFGKPAPNSMFFNNEHEVLHELVPNLRGALERLTADWLISVSRALEVSSVSMKDPNLGKFRVYDLHVDDIMDIKVVWEDFHREVL